VTMELQRGLAGPPEPSPRKPLLRRRRATTPSIDGQTLRAAVSLPVSPVFGPATVAKRRARPSRDRARHLRHVLLLGDALVAAGCCALAVQSNSVPMGVAAAVWFIALVGATVTGAQPDVRSLRRALMAGTFAVSILAVSAAVTGGPFTASFRHHVFGLALGTLAAVTLRLVVRAVPVASVLGSNRSEAVLLVGDRRSVADTVAQWNRAGDSHRFVGVCLTDDDGQDAAADVEGVSVLGGLAEVAEAAVQTHSHTVAVLPGPGVDSESLRKLAWALEPAKIGLSVVTPLLDVAHHRARTDVIGRQVLVRVSHSVPAGLHATLKSVVDRVLAGLLLVMVIPVLAVIAVCIRLDSDGPALFRQQRVREGGRRFTMLKFRTMSVDAEQAKAALTALNDHGNGILFKMRNDPRITRVGRVLRATSLDELPQLVNVLRGEMSLVGPRPALPSEVALYDETAERRLAVKPGLTGLWQVSGRSNLSWDESLRLDLHYVDNWRHRIDLGILVRTIKTVVRRDGAC